MYAKNIRPCAKRKVQTELSTTIESHNLGMLKFRSEARDENVPTKWAHFPNRSYTAVDINYIVVSNTHVEKMTFRVEKQRVKQAISRLFLITVEKCYIPQLVRGSK